MRQEEANQTALAAIGPRKKRKTDFGEISSVSPLLNFTSIGKIEFFSSLPPPV